ncbi:MAG: hypothetical protein ACYS0K_19855 [Planctomycetota bacterium]|jgi:hypothetical protein
MKTKKRRSRAEKPRFRIARLEERIAPKKGGIPGWYCAYGGYGQRYNPHGKPIGRWDCGYGR